MRPGIVIGLLAAASVVACAKDGAAQDAQPKPNLSVSIVPYLAPAEVTNVAKRLAISNGIDLRSYDEPVVRSEIVGGQLIWRASFHVNAPAPPGGHFVVLVKDSTKQATYVAGE